jgi:formylglycine-generating enzyme required for sulfatase activity
MRHFFLRSLGVVILAAALCATAGQAHAEKRVALVIGNSAYRNVPSLPNPTNDADQVAALFKSAGFSTVELRHDLGIAEMRRAISDFAETASDVDVAVIYFAGHGIEIDGANYIIPVDARLLRDFDIEDETVSVDRILKSIEPANKLRLVILDACRDNPFLKTMKRSIASRSVGRGLAKVEPALSDTLIAFAAKAGSVALDGDAKNSPFTLALLHNIATPGLDLRIAFGRVRDEVLKTTDRRQEPFVYGSLGGSVISIVDAPKIPPLLSTDEIVWNAIKDSSYPAIFDDFASKFPSSPRLVAALARRDELKKEIAAAAARVPPPPTADEIVWNAIKDSGYPAIFEDFIGKFPSSLHLADAERRRDELKKQIAAAAPRTPSPSADDIVWNAIKESRDPAILEEFVSRYSASPHLVDARQRRDDLKKQIADATARVPPPPATDEIVWDAIKDARTAAIFAEYLSKFPESVHGADARARFDELRKQEELKQEEVKQRQVAALAPMPPPAPREQAASNGIDLKLKVLDVAAEADLKPKAVFKECDRCPEMVVVSAGSFMMGSAENESHREAVEGPQHRVTVGHRFAAGRFAVTFDEWDACVADGGCNGYRPWDNGWGRGKRPVISVSWQDAKNYVAWLSQRTGKSYRLLSEAEREYVARAGTTSPFWWGASVSRRNANYDDRSAKDKPANAASSQKTLPVDSFQANPWGFYQVSGNVWEWVEDCMNDDYAGAPADGTPRLSGNCQRRVLRGGSWISEAFMLRSAGRYGVQADGRVGNVGFRIARELND